MPQFALFSGVGSAGNCGRSGGSVGELLSQGAARGAARRFNSDGEFGSWMIRMLINEVVLVANRRVPETSEMSEAAYPEAR
jgi:hypothetical protein